MGRYVRALFALVCAAVLLPGMASAQEGATISGRVTSEAGAPLASASVFLEGMNIGTLTRDDGRYSFVVPAARVTGQQVTITARLIGYKSQSARISLSAGAITQNFVLAANPLRLGEVVVTGAGTQTTRERLGTVINTVDSTLIQRSNEPNIVNAIAGAAPNVQVVSQSGEPGASAFIQIRGIRSFSGTGQPLFVVDGVPIDNSTNATGDPTASTVTPNRASDIDPNDIASVEVLKGPAASAIYGARAADGVIIITTKSGQAGPTRYSLRTNYSFDDVNKGVPLQTDYGQAGTCSTLNCSAGSTSWGPKLDAGTPVYDHFNELFNTGHSLDANLQASGGNDRTTFFWSTSYLDQNGTIIGPNNWYKKSNARLTATHRIFDRLTVGGNIAYIDAKGSFIQKGSNISGLLLGALRTPPDFNNFPYLDPTSGLQRSYRFPFPGPTSLTTSRGYDNPVFLAYADANDEETNRAIGNINLNYDALDWLKFKYTLGADYYGDYRLNGFPFTSSSYPTGQVTRADIYNLQIDHNLLATLQHTFSPDFAGTLTLGQNLNIRRYRQNFTTGYNLIGVQPFALQNTVNWQPNEFRYTIHTESYFGQAELDMYNQLYLTAAVRNDGFSTFVQNKLRAWYPKASLAWVFTNALGNTDQTGLLSYGKLRAAYGETGKPPGVYSTITTLNSGGFGNGWGDFLNATQAGYGGLFGGGSLGNNDLLPERDKEFEVGADFGFFSQKMDAGVTYYNQLSSNVILFTPLAPSSGYSSQILNGARIRNTGFEATMNFRPITRQDWSWDVGLQWAKNNNKVLSITGAQFYDIAGGTFSGSYGAATVGHPYGMRGEDFARCGQSPNDQTDNLGNPINLANYCAGAPKGALVIDTTGYPIYDFTDRVIADPSPTWTGSIRTSLRYRKWTFSALVDHKQGGQVWDGTRGALDYFGTHKDTDIRDQMRTFGKDYFQGPVVGPGAGMAVPIDVNWFTSLSGSGFTGPASQFVEDGTYTKLREISVAYSFDQPWVQRTLSFSSIDLRVAGRNLHTWTKYRGIDPETNLGGAEVLFQGADYFNNPQTRSIVVSIGLNR